MRSEDGVVTSARADSSHRQASGLRVNEAVRRNAWFWRPLARLDRALDRHGETLRTAATWLGAALVVVVIFATLSPLALRPILTRSADLERFLAFAALGSCFVFAVPRRWLPILAFLVLFGGALEAAQNLRPDRHGLWHDFDWKAAGACVGAASALAAHRLLRWLGPIARGRG